MLLVVMAVVLFCAQEDDRKLLKEIGKNGEGRPEEVQQLIDEVYPL